MPATPFEAITPPQRASIIPRAILILSDLHLSPSIPLTVQAFERFIDALDPVDVDAVYILGDLFEFWIGDDSLESPFAAGIAAKLASVSQRGMRLFVMHGNRDFLLGKRFARTARATLLADPHPLEAFGQHWLLTHGDALCTEDLSYQRFRAIVRRRWVQWLFLRWPLRWRTQIATNMRAKSEQAGASRMQISDVAPKTVAALFDTYSGIDALIQGHTHRPARHDESRDGRTLTRWVLSDWELDHAPQRASFLRLDTQGTHVISVQ